jgi:hypothetical protein
MAISVADSNSSIREALTTILRETAADARRALSEIPERKDPDKPRTKAWRCSCGSHLIPPRRFRALQDVRRRKVLSHFATAFLLEAFVYLEKKKAATEPARNFFADSHTSRAWLTVALGINDATVERKSRFFPWFVSGGKPPKQLVLNHERTAAAKPLAAALNAALERKLKELAAITLIPKKSAPLRRVPETTPRPPAQVDTADAETVTTRGAEVASSVVSPTGAGQAKPTPNRDSLLASRVARKLKDPDGNPVMTVKEVAFACSKSASTVYRWVNEGKLNWAPGVKGRIPTKDVKQMLQPSDK